MGEERFTDSSHYEELKMGTNTLSVDWFRHGVEYTERAEEAMGMRSEIVNGLPTALGEWAGRLKSENQHDVPRTDPRREQDRPWRASHMEAIVNYAAMMRRWGAASAKVPGMVNGQKFAATAWLLLIPVSPTWKRMPTSLSAIKTTTNAPPLKPTL